MGNAMACCGKNESDPNNFKVDDFSNIKGDKLRMIIRLQAAFRGYLARKRVG